MRPLAAILLLISIPALCTTSHPPVALKTETIQVVDATDLRFTSISTAEGLSQTRVGSMVQDDQGFLWFGTQYGLNRFDGYAFKVFVHEAGNPNSLSGVNVTALFKDRSGALWIGCERLLNRLDPKQETFSHYPIPAAKFISQDRKGFLWVSTSSGLFRLDPVSGKVRAYVHDPNNPDGLHINEIRSATEDKGGTIWIADADGMHEFDPETGHLGFHLPVRNPGRDFSFYEDRLGIFWLFYGSGHGLASFDKTSKLLTTYTFEGKPLTSAALTGITGMLEDREGNLWLASQGLGLLKFDRQRKRFLCYRHSPDRSDSLSEDRVNTLLEDREGNVWVAFFGKGLMRFGSKAPPFQPFAFPQSAVKVPTSFGCFYEDRQGNLWLGARSAIYRVDRSGAVAAFSPMKPGAALDVMAIVQDRADNIWVGTFNHGLYQFHPQTGAWKNYRHNEKDPQSLSSDIAGRLMVDREGSLWIATWDGLNRFEAATGRFDVFRADASNRELQYFSIVEGPDKNIWLGTNSFGLHRFDPRTSQFTAFPSGAGASFQLSNNEVNSILVARNGALWLSTQNGLNRFDTKTGSVEAYTSRDGLAGNALSCVLEDDKGQLWIATNKGVSSFDPAQKVFRNFTMADGLPGLEMGGWGACGKTSQGLMMFAGFSGSTMFRPLRVSIPSYAPPVVFTEFKVVGPRQYAGRSPINVGDSGASPVTLSHDQNVFAVTFAALSYADPKARRYRYMLDNLDSSWNEVDSDHRSVTYTKLPAGEYRLRVQSATGNSDWNEPGAQMHITVLPPWWNTWWFRTMYLLALCLSIWMAYRWKMRQLAGQFELRLEERINERARIARELHDTLLQSFQGLLLRFQTALVLLPQRPADAKEALATALERADTALIEGRDAIQELRSHPAAVNDFLHRIGNLALDLQEETNNQESSLRTIVEGSPRPLQTIVQEEVQSIVKEALRNAFAHSRAQNIEVEVAYSERKFRVRIRDDGQGLDPELLRNGGRAGHWGLAGMRERAEKLGAKYELWSEVDAGTEIQLSVPASIAYAKPSNKAPESGFQTHNRRAK